MEIAIIPRWFLRFFVPDRDHAYHLNILLSNLFLIVVLFLIYKATSSDSFLPNICLIDHFLGVECPFCGCTRSLGALFHGDMASAWNYNRVAVLFGAYLFLQLPLRVYLIARRFAPGHKLDRISNILGKIIFLGFILNWIINLITN